MFIAWHKSFSSVRRFAAVAAALLTIGMVAPDSFASARQMPALLLHGDDPGGDAGALVAGSCSGQVDCGNQTCCPLGTVCVLDGTACCPSAFPYPCPGDLCFDNPECDPCPGQVDCGNDQCCAAGNVCVLDGTACCPTDFPYPCPVDQCSSDPTCGAAVCGDANDDGDITAADALSALRTAVGNGSCDLAHCDYNGDASVSAGDALAILRVAVGGAGNPQCPA
jgi:hypothetical protein